ncbi:MAG: translation initiation factor IF-2 [Nitrososphaerota archaeon]
MKNLREPIVVVLGHVDHGKTSLLDKMRGTIVAAREAGGITQQIGASLFPLDAVVETCRSLLGEVKVDLKVPGILFIDTPGHAVFANMRKRGGSVADLAILVVDVMKGVQEQTVESIKLLRARKTPFVVALTKIDMIPGWRPLESAPISKAFAYQSKSVVEELEKRIYLLAGELSQHGFQADLYTRITSFAKTLAIVPVSAKSGEGIPDLLMLVLGLAQVYLRDRLALRGDGCEGVVLEIVEEEGMGVTINAVISNGVLRVGDRIALLGKDGPFLTRVRALMMPKPLDEMRDPRDRFKAIEEVVASAGVKIVAEGLEQAFPGSPIYGLRTQEEAQVVFDRLSAEVGEFRISTDKVGIVVKADSLGALESLVAYLHERGLSVRLADIGEVSKRDVMEASIVREKDEFLGVILAYNVDVSKSIEIEAANRGVKIFRNPVLFRLIDEYIEWVDKTKSERERAEFEKLVKPGKIRIIEGMVFRRSNPAIVGVEVVGGLITPRVSLMNEEGKIVGTIMQIQDMGKAVPVATAGMKVAISMKEPIVGRHVKENEYLYVAIPENDARLLSTVFMNKLDEQSRKILDEVLNINRKINPLWAR